MITKLPDDAMRIADSIPKLPGWKGRAMIHKLKDVPPADLPRELARMAEIGPPYAKLVEALISAGSKDTTLPTGSPMNKQTTTVNTL